MGLSLGEFRVGSSVLARSRHVSYLSINEVVGSLSSAKCDRASLCFHEVVSMAVVTRSWVSVIFCLLRQANRVGLAISELWFGSRVCSWAWHDIALLLDEIIRSLRRLSRSCGRLVLDRAHLGVILARTRIRVVFVFMRETDGVALPLSKVGGALEGTRSRNSHGFFLDKVVGSARLA